MLITTSKAIHLAKFQGFCYQREKGKMDIKIHIIRIYLSIHILRYINMYISMYTCLKCKRTASPIDQIDRISQGRFLDLSEVLKEDLSIESSLLTAEQEFEGIQGEARKLP